MDNLYDEFGNYIGPELDEESSGSEQENNNWENEENTNSITGNGQDNIEVDYEAKLNNSIPSSTLLEYKQENAIVLHEDKQYYATSSQLYGPDTEILVEEQDTQPIDQPIIQPNKGNKLNHFVETIPPDQLLNYNLSYFTNLTDSPLLIRHIAIAGAIHSGKTTLMDIFINQTHNFKQNLNPKAANHEEKENSANNKNNKTTKSNPNKPTRSEQIRERYLDSRFSERSRGLSIKSHPISLLLPSLHTQKSYYFNLIDTPGHIDFNDEMSAVYRLVDGVVICIDAAEGVNLNTRRAIIHAIQENLAIIICLNKLDRLVLELKLPAVDTYHKLQYIVEQINALLAENNSSQRVSPLNNTVLFASGRDNYIFSLESFAKLYTERYNSKAVDSRAFSAHLWGNSYYNKASRRFTKQPNTSEQPRSFVEFVLEPLYKIYSHSISLENEELNDFLGKIGIKLSKEELKLNNKALLRAVFSQFFGNSAGFVSSCVENVPSPLDSNKIKFKHNYLGSHSVESSENSVKSILECEKNCDSFYVNVTKLYNRAENSTIFDSFGRVYAGTVRVGDSVRVLGANYNVNGSGNLEDSSVRTISRIWIYNGRYRIEVNQITAGNLALFEGIDASIMKFATFTTNSTAVADKISIFRPLALPSVATMALSIEPLVATQLPTVLEGLRAAEKSYPLLHSKVEESGEHVIFGPGELYLDCVLHDLREIYTGSEIKVADPVVKFQETSSAPSATPAFAISPNKLNKINVEIEPLEEGLAEELQQNKLALSAFSNDERKRGNYLIERFSGQNSSEIQGNFDEMAPTGWDILSARSIWAFGPEDSVENTNYVEGNVVNYYTNYHASYNILVDNTHSLGSSSSTEKKLLFSAKDSIIQGFQWATRAGPLVEEPIRGLKFKINQAELAPQPLQRARGQIIPTARKACYSAFLLGQPRLLEPVYSVEIICPADAVVAINKVLQRRRGLVVEASPRAGSPLHTVTCSVPLIELFGFETDLRIHTAGQAFPQSCFSKWQEVPGDPLDKSIVIKPLEPSPLNSLAREFLLKTRRRKGLSEDVAWERFFDPELFEQISQAANAAKME
jgi:U5 small nuclear ribonucleoprotein component